MTCSTLHPEIALLVGGELSPERRPAVERHLDSCAACRRLAAELRADRHALTELADEPIDRTTLDRIRGRLSARLAEERSAPPPPSHADRDRHRTLAALAAVLATLCLGLALWYSVQRTAPGATERVAVEAPTASHPAPGAGDDTGPRTAPEASASPEDRASEPRVARGSGQPAGEDQASSPASEPAAPPEFADGTRPAGASVPDRLADAGPAPTRPTPTEPIEPPGVPADEPIATAPREASITIRIVSDNPDIVFYWLVDEPKEVPDDAAV